MFPNGNWVYPLGPRNDTQLEGAIDNQGGWRHAARRVYENRCGRSVGSPEKTTWYGTYRLLVVTDGEANDANLVEGYTPDIISRGITIDAIGVEMESRHTLATKVHSYRSADDPESLRQAINEVFAEVSSSDTGTAGEDAFEMIADLPSDTRLRCSRRCPPPAMNRSVNMLRCAALTHRRNGAIPRRQHPRIDQDRTKTKSRMP